MWSDDEEAEFVDLLYAEMTSDETRHYPRMANNYRRNRAAKETRLEIAATQVQEAKRAEAALSDAVTHREVTQLEPVDYQAPPVLPTPLDAEPAGTDGSMLYTIGDRDGHQHTFKLEFIYDRSADFIGVYEENRGGENHTVWVNMSHSALDDIVVDANTHLLLQRIAFAMASAEVFLTMPHKQQVREWMNEHLRLIGTQVLND